MNSLMRFSRNSWRPLGIGRGIAFFQHVGFEFRKAGLARLDPANAGIP